MSIKTIFVIGPAYSGRTTFCNTFVNLNPDFTIDKMWTSNQNADPKYYHIAEKETIDEHRIMFDVVVQTIENGDTHVTTIQRNRENKIFVMPSISLSLVSNFNNSLVVVLDPERDFVIKNFVDSNFYENERSFAKKTIELWESAEQCDKGFDSFINNILDDEEVFVLPIRTHSLEYRSEAAQLIRKFC